MIKSIELVNWKSHSHSLINFSKGNNIFIGNMGSGKSSIMDAISYALFGKIPSNVKISSIIKNRPKQEENALVKISFSKDNNIYTIERELKLIGDKLQTTAKIYKNGSYMNAQPERVNEDVESILGIDYT